MQKYLCVFFDSRDVRAVWDKEKETGNEVVWYNLFHPGI